MDLNKSGLALTLGAAAFAGYCVYFDYKRRSSADYKQKIRENRRAKEEGNRVAAGGGEPMRRLPTRGDAAAMQQFIHEEIQLGEQLMGEGQVEKGVEHFSNAIVVCAQGEQLLGVFQQAMPPAHFHALLAELPAAQRRMVDLFRGGEREIDETEDRAIQTLIEDELE